jgi:hypothetical protein
VQPGTLQNYFRRGNGGGSTLLDLQWAKGIIAAVLIGSVAVVFWQQILGFAVFIGESDRLNSYLNIRLAEYDALKEYGRVPTWNANMFGGFSLAGLHWMNPGTDPIAYILQLLPRNEVFRALGFISILLVLAACCTSFLYIRDVTGADGPALVGGLAYGFSVFSLHRSAQVDNAELTVVLIPLGLLALRRAQPANLMRPMIGLTLVMTALAFWGFLQEAAYAFLFFGCYALYRGFTLRRMSWNAAWAPIVVIAAACMVALVFSAPRLLNVQQEFLSLARTTELHYYDYSQILRFFHEGFYGRYFEEGHLLGHGMNLHEGLQLVSSTALVIFVCLGIIRPRSRSETIAAIAFFALFAATLPASDLIYGLARRFLPNLFLFSPSLNFFKVLFYGTWCLLIVLTLIRVEPYLRIGARLRRLTPIAPRPADTSFHLFTVIMALFAIVVYEGTYLVYRLFGRADFTHTRLSILVLLPLCTLFAVYLAELKDLPIHSRARDILGRRLPILMVVLAGGIAYLINGPLLDSIISRNAVKIILLHNAIMPTVLLRVCLTAFLLCGLMVAVIFAKAKTFSIQSAACILVGVFVLVETLTYAHFKVNGPQTWTYPVPFRMFNYFNVPPSVMQPPGDAKLTEFHQSFDIENSRIAVFSDDCAFPGTKIPHVAGFWNARTIGGYGTGVSKRLAMLPWPKGVQTLRTIDFTSTRSLDASVFSLLAFLNVRYFLVLTPDVYFNVATRDLPAHCDKQDFAIGNKIYPLQKRDIAGISFRYLENPVKPLPRHFLVGQVIGSQEPPIPLATLPKSPTNSGIRLFERQTNDLTHTSFAERCFAGMRQFDASGDLSVSYRGDVIDVRVTPSAQERFLVLSESYNPQWRVYAGDTRTETIPTNLVMNGVLIPAGLDRVSLRFEPFSSQRWAQILILIALFGFLILTVTLWRAQDRWKPA